MSAAQIVQATYDVAQALNQLKHDGGLIDAATCRAVNG
jgi:hypothetical protein